MKKIHLFLSLFCLVSACTEDKTARPSYDKYKVDTDLMIQVASKLNEERDPRAMHKSIAMLQASRAVSCDDYNGECDKFNEYLQLALESSEGESFADGTQAKLRSKYSEMLKAIEAGRAELKPKNAN